MSARAEREAARDYLAATRRAVSCVTDELVIQIASDQPRAWSLRFARNSALLRTTPRLRFFIGLDYALGFDDATASRIATFRRYYYELEDSEGREVFAYHLHPTGLSSVTGPHVHAGCSHPLFDLGRTHLPTGIVSLQAVTRCLIVEFGVPPLRPDWKDVLADV